jgi:hypothetical protein
MAVCGERYKHLAVTTDGYSFENPYGHFGTPYVYVQWRAVAEKIVKLGVDHLEELDRIQEEHGLYEGWGELVADKDELVEHFDDLPWVTTVAISGFHVESGIAEAMTVTSEALCFLERVDLAIESYKRAVPSIPGIVPEKKGPAKLPGPTLPLIGEVPWGYVIAGVVVVGTVALYRRAKGR